MWAWSSSNPKGEIAISAPFKASKEFEKERATLALDGKRRCNKCHEIKDLEADFSANKRSPNGRQGHCKACHTVYVRSLRRSHNRRKGRLEQAEYLMKKQGRYVEDFTVDELETYWIKELNHDPDTCYYTGIKLQNEDKRATDFHNLDHIVPRSDERSEHSMANIVPASHGFNNFKQDKPVMTAYLTAPEQHQPIQCYVGLADGMARVDGLGTPAVPAETRWSPSEHKGEPVPMKFCDYLRTFHQDSAGTAVDSIQNDALESPVSA